MKLARTRPRLLLHLLVFVLALTGGLAIHGRTLAQDAQSTPVTVTQDEVNEVARGLWCPLCSGVRLDACELKACDQMKDVIAIKLGEGEDAQTIKDYFIQQYGPQVLGEPPFTGFSWLAWILPVAAVVGGGLFLWSRARSMTRPARPESAAAATGSVDVVEGELAQRLDEEIRQHE